VTTSRTDRKARMAGAGANRASGAAPRIAVAVRTKAHRITLDLDPAAFKDLERWVGATSAEVDGRVTLAEALRAMIAATIQDEMLTAEVRARIRQART
jgi:hypothetical protein